MDASKVEASNSSKKNIYDDALASEWKNWSWKSTVNFDNNNPTFTGEKAISFKPASWGGLYLNSISPIEIIGTGKLSFNIYSDRDDPVLKVLFYDAANNKLNTEVLLSDIGGSIKSKTWKNISLPLDAVSKESGKIKGFAIQEFSGNDSIQFYIDDIAFEGVGETADNVENTDSIDNSGPYTIYDDALASGWMNWSWKGTADLSYGFQKNSGSKSISFKHEAQYSGLYLHTDPNLSVDAAGSVTFAARSSNDSLKYQIAFYGADLKPLTGFVSLLNYGGHPVSNGWKSYSIPVSVLNPSNSDISGISIQEFSGSSAGNLFVDDLVLSDANSGSENSPVPSDPQPSEPPKTTVPSGSSPTLPSPSGNGYTAVKNTIYRDGKPIQLRGVSWFGFETGTYVVHGLWERNWKDMITQMKSLNINAVRVPFCPTTLRGVTVNSIDYSKNTDLRGLNSLEILDRVMGELNSQGMYILLDHHTPDCKNITNLWYTDSYSESQWISDLKFLSARYKNLAYFMGMDIKNEPQGTATWGTGNVKTDWNTAAEKAGKEVLSQNPNILIYVQGVQNNPTCSTNTAHWWGGNLEPVACTPISTASIPANKLVFSPHVYGPDVHLQGYFSDANFPDNMPYYWDTHFGYLVDKGYTIVPGEWGGKYGNGGGDSRDRIWQDAIVKYFKNKKICNTFYWDWNPNSSDTGGILQNDWKTPWKNKVDMLNNYYSSCK